MSIIYALATPPAQSAICVFRVSGEGCLDALSKLFNSELVEPRYFYKTEMLNNGAFIDSVAVVFFKGPKSFTGEDSFEVYAHGGLAVMRVRLLRFLMLLVLKRLSQASFRKGLSLTIKSP